MTIGAESLAAVGGAVALAGGLGGAAIGMAIAGYKGVATLAEQPQYLRSVIILAAIPMSCGLYGLIVLIIILTVVVPKIAAMPDPGGSGFAVVACSVIAACAFAFSGISLGSVCGSGISSLIKTRGQILTNALVLAVFVELIAVLGVVFTILALTMLGLM